jgi:TATA-box binding protein (TBP) (component of TFIID and TFIIIB)
MDSFPYIQKLDAIRKDLVADPQRPDPSWVRITTITMISKFLQEIDLKKFKEKFKELGSVTVRRKGSKFRGFEWNMKDTAFYNQVTIGYQDAYSRKSIKIFGNGAIQVAGCSDLFDCRRILKQLSFILAAVLELDAPPPVADADVKMINTNFSLNSSVNLNKIITKFAKVPGFKVTFDPDRYSAVKVKFVPGVGMKQVTASIFSTGKIIVTGAQTLDEIAQAYKILNENDNDPIDDKFYNEMSVSSTETFSQNPNSFIEEKYDVLTSAKTGGTEILNGTVAITNASVDVVGTSTRFFKEIKIGDTIAVGTSRIERVVASVSNNTFLTVSFFGPSNFSYKGK